MPGAGFFLMTKEWNHIFQKELIVFLCHVQTEGRNLLEQIDYGKGTVCIDGTEYPLTSCHFPTIDPSDPCRLTKEGQEVIDRLTADFPSPISPRPVWPGTL